MPKPDWRLAHLQSSRTAILECFLNGEEALAASLLSGVIDIALDAIRKAK